MFSTESLLKKVKRTLNNRLPIYLPFHKERTRQAGLYFARLVEIVTCLRSPTGCEWDKKQTLSTILPDLKEEAMEAMEAGEKALQTGNFSDFQEELGDLMFLITLLSQICAEQKAFHISDVTRSITEKMQRRHPHVFGDVYTNDPNEIAKVWSKIKSDERREKTGANSFNSVLDGVPKGLSALHSAHNISKKAAQTGFKWPNLNAVWEKVEEEISELKQAILSESKQRQEEELGDLLFTIVNIARHLNLDSERSLKNTNIRFTKRFQWIEKALLKNKSSIHNSNINELEALWVQAKKALL